MDQAFADFLARILSDIFVTLKASTELEEARKDYLVSNLRTAIAQLDKRYSTFIPA